MKARQPINPFYGLLAVVGVVFVITATAYVVMTCQRLAPPTAEPATPSRFLDFMDQHGFATMMGEVGLLAILSFAAMAMDSYRSRNRGAES